MYGKLKIYFGDKRKRETEIKEVEHRLQEFEKNKLNLNIDIDSLKGYEKEWSNFVEGNKEIKKIRLIEK